MENVTPPLTTVDSRKKYIYGRLKGAGFSDIHASAILGNLLRENATLDPTKYNMEGSGAVGIAQWLGNGRKGKLMAEYGNNALTLPAQTDFLIKEITDPKYFNNSWLSKNNYQKFLNASDISEATYIFSDEFERAGAHEKKNDVRVNNAVNVYKQMTGQELSIPKSTPTTSFKPTENANIPTEQGNSFKVEGDYNLNNPYEIREEKETTEEEENQISEVQLRLLQRDAERKLALSMIPQVKAVEGRKNELKLQNINI